MKTLTDVLLVLGTASLVALLWSLQPGKWLEIKDKVLLVSFMGLLAFGPLGAVLNAWGS